ncbi:MAG: hypothetical protein LBF89_06555 [Bacteroidales bacterium]|jgi:hypothetical protein|nr:hypothetical protein [Bacteroidales bacterium]
MNRQDEQNDVQEREKLENKLSTLTLSCFENLQKMQDATSKGERDFFAARYEEDRAAADKIARELGVLPLEASSLDALSQ